MSPDARVVAGRARRRLLAWASPARAALDLGATFARASTATYRDAAGVMRTAAAGEMREWKHYIGGAPTTLLEPASTNVLLRSQEFGNAAWTNVGTPIVVSDVALAPDGTMTADSIQDNEAAQAAGRRQTVAIANDAQWWVSSVCVAKSAVATGVLLNTRLTGGATVVDVVSVVRPTDGQFFTGVNTGAGGGGIEDWGTFYRIYCAAQNNTTGNVLGLVTVFPSYRGNALGGGIDVAAQGTQIFWGAMLEKGRVPTSYIPTVGAAVLRAGDALSFPWNLPPGEMTVYTRHTELGTILDPGTAMRVWQIGKADNSSPRLFVRCTAGGYDCFHGNGIGSVNATVAPSPAMAALVELRAQLRSNGAVRLGQSIAGATETLSAESAALAIAAAWSAPTRLTVNDAGPAAAQGIIALRSLVVARGVQSLATMRGL